VVLFGGYSPSCGSYCNDTWTWNGSTWSQLQSSNTPPGRYGAAVAFDPSSSATLLFGGYGLGGIRSDTWLLTATGWQQATPTVSPPARGLTQMVWDPDTASIVLFGGIGYALLADTWTWTAGVWTQQSPLASPPPRNGFGLTYDATTHRVVLFGGVSATGVYLADTWTWDGVSWTQQSPAMSPPSRANAAMSYDAALQQTVLFGGLAYQPGPVLLSDTWAWNGQNWTQLTPATAPPARSDGRLVTSVGLRTAILFGGCADISCGTLLGDTWTLKPSH
jgi:hypothetical protein